MTHLESISIGREMMYYSMMLAMPALVLSLFVGLVISVLQAVTSIQEQTLTFVPRIVALGILFILTMPWMLETAVYFMTHMLATAAKVSQ